MLVFDQCNLFNISRTNIGVAVESRVLTNIVADFYSVIR
jgi:hypothetical protein